MYKRIKKLLIILLILIVLLINMSNVSAAAEKIVDIKVDFDYTKVQFISVKSKKGKINLPKSWDMTLKDSWVKGTSTAGDLTLLFWAPLEDHFRAGKDSSSCDYAIIYYSLNNRSFYVVRVDGIDMNSGSGDVKEADWRKKGIFGSARITSIYKVASLDSNGNEVQEYSWLQACPGFKGGIGSSTMTYSTETRSYDLVFKDGYKSSTYLYEDIFCTIEDQAKDMIGNKKGNKLSSDQLGSLDALLRIIGNQIIEDPDMSNIVGDSWKDWFATKDLKTDFISLRLKSINDTINIQAHYNDFGENVTSTSDLELTQLASLLTILDLQDVDSTKYKTLYKVLEAYKYATSSLQKVVTTGNADELDKIDNMDNKDFEALTAYQKWAYTIANYVGSDGKKKTLSKVVMQNKTYYTMDKDGEQFENFGETKIPNSNDKLTKEEKLRLQTFLYLAISKSESKATAPKKFELPDDLIKWSSSNNLEVMPGGTLSPDSVRNSIDLTLRNLPTTESTASFTSISANFRAIAEYVLLKSYGYKSVNKTSKDLSEFQSSDFLESIILTMDESIGTIYYPYVIGIMSNVPYIFTDADSTKAYEQLQYMLMCVATYAKSYAGITVETENGKDKYVCQALDDFKSKADPDPANAVMSDDIKAIISAYVGIREGLEYLGVSPFTPELQYIWDMYESLSSYKESTALQDYVLADKDKEPMRAFFDLENKKLSYFYNVGVAASATYIPMQTNLYSATSISNVVTDTDFVEQFHYPFGFYRKALFIDTNTSAAVDTYVSGKTGKKRVACLRDMLEPEKDIVLYLDDNFYNIDKLAEMQGYTYNRLSNTEEASKDGSETSSVTSFISDLWGEWTETSVENVCKTGPVESYSSNIKRKGSEYGSAKVEGTDYLLSDASIDKYLTGYTADKDVYDVYNEYTPIQSFAVVSAIYRKSALFTICNKLSKKQEPVFVSSPNLAKITNISRKAFDSIYSYTMLKNLKGNLGIDYKTTLDLDSPIYMDIYGNIITESGLVIIPAASNPQLYRKEAYEVTTAGFLSLYNNNLYSIPNDLKNADKYMSSYLVKDLETGSYKLQAIDTNELYINLADLSISDINVTNTLMELMQTKLNSDCLEFNSAVWRITEVMRGAPIENINKEFEGIKGIRDISKVGISSAYKLENLADAVLSSSNGNSMLSLPNPAYMDGIEYVILFGIKVIFVVSIVLVVYKVYIDAIQGHLGLRTLYKLASTIALFAIVISSVPYLMNLSYYQVNKRLLQKEAKYIALLNLEKRSDGREIGIISVDEPKSNSVLYIKLDDLTIPWYDIVDDVLVSSTFATMQEVYDTAFDGSALANLPGVLRRSNGLYMDVNYIFDTCNVEYSAKDNVLYTALKETPYMSFVTPYYVFLDLLVSRVNDYNKEKELKSFNTKVQPKGEVRAIGVSKNYFISNDFMSKSQDVLGLKSIYNVDNTLIEKVPFSEDQITRMKNSLWYQDNLTEEELEERIESLNQKARMFVADNRDLLGKVTDETFLKVMALSLALDHNNIFGISSARDLEIFSIDTRDLIRVSVANRSITMQDTSKSFARFIYDNGGEVAVVVTAILICIYWVASVVKPMCTILIIVLMIAALVIRKLLKKDSDQAIEGFLISLAMLCLINVVYALTLKLTIIVPALSGTIVKAVVAQMVIQFFYFLLLIWLTSFVIRDWSNLGFNKFMYVGRRVKSGISRRRYEGIKYSKERSNPETTGQSYYDLMEQRDRRRQASYMGTLDSEIEYNRRRSRRILGGRRGKLKEEGLEQDHEEK